MFSLQLLFVAVRIMGALSIFVVVVMRYTGFMSDPRVVMVENIICPSIMVVVVLEKFCCRYFLIGLLH